MTYKHIFRITISEENYNLGEELLLQSGMYYDYYKIFKEYCIVDYTMEKINGNIILQAIVDTNDVTTQQVIDANIPNFVNT